MRSKDTKFRLNDSDIAFLSDESIFLKKQQVTEKIMALFGSLESDIQQVLPSYKSNLPATVLTKSGKISRGENYRGLPWMVLDCPATFGKDGVFAYRTLFWWSHPFSCTFHLSGKYLDQHLKNLSENLFSLDKSMMVCINTSQWEHHYEISNYIPLSEFLETITDPEKYFREKGFLKFSKTVNLEQHQNLLKPGTEFLEQLLNCLR